MATIAAYLVLESQRGERTDKTPSFDWIGAGLSACMLTTFLLVMTNGPKLGWGSTLILGLIVAVLILVATFIWWELHVPSPMLDLKLFRRRLFSFGLSASFISFIGMSSVRFLMPFYLQTVLGYSPAKVGLIIVPAAIATIITGPLGGRLSDRYGWTRFNVGGLILSATGLFILSRLTVDSAVWLVMFAMVIQSAGISTFNAPNSSAILSTVARSNYGVVSAFLNVVRNSANVTGIALVTAIVTAEMARMGFPPSLAAVSDGGGRDMLAAFTLGLRITYLATGSLVLVGMLLSLVKGGGSPSTHPERTTQHSEHTETEEGR